MDNSRFSIPSPSAPGKLNKDLPPSAKSKLSPYMISSVLLHTALLGGLLLASLPSQQKAKSENVAFDVSDAKPTTNTAPARAAEQKPALAEQAAPAQPEIGKSSSPKPAAKVASVRKTTAATPSAPAIATPAKIAEPTPSQPLAAPEAAVVATSAPQDLAQDSNVEVPAETTADDTATTVEQSSDEQAEQKMEATPVVAAPVKAEEVDESLKATPVAEPAAADVEKEAEQPVAETEATNQKAQAASLAAAQAQAAQEAAAAQRAQQEQQAAAKAAAAAANESATRGSGNGGQGTPTVSKPAPITVRTIEQIKQLPGNPKPTYSDAERLSQQQGQATYLAYISKSGVPSDFKLVKSTGHKSLDEKTLSALRQWKFYPGQEGWVEIPVNWDLKGGPQEVSALGRRNAALSKERSGLRTQ